MQRTIAILAAALLLDDPRYLKDFEFIADSVKSQYAALRTKNIEWPEVTKSFRARFADCANDRDHVLAVMELLATLKDSHTGVTDTKVNWKELPSKFDGLFGGGLWFGWDAGKFVLRGMMEGHALADRVPLGSILTSIQGVPAWLAMERERRRVATFQGLSSPHSFFASLGNRLLPFGDQSQLELEFLLPDGKRKSVNVPRWGPGGKAFDPSTAFLPEGASYAEGALSTMLKTPWSKKVGYLKITGGMDAQTVKVFHQAFDALKGMEALLLDCRGMGGGSDDCAWEMCGRLFSKGVNNGRHGRIEPNGSWQFDGPLVMLQDEMEVSSAETFTWAMSETGRAVSVGRATGGWGIIPKRFDCPSGLLSFRLGVNDRPTPIQGVHTEGIGWPPDLLLPLGPAITSKHDPAQEFGFLVLSTMHAGLATVDVRAAFRALFEGDLSAFRTFGKKAEGKAKDLDLEKLSKLFLEDLKGEIELEVELLRLQETAPDVQGAASRLSRQKTRAKASGLAEEVAKLEKALQSAKADAAAEEDLLSLLDARFQWEESKKKSFLSKHGATRLGRFVREKL